MTENGRRKHQQMPGCPAATAATAATQSAVARSLNEWWPEPDVNLKLLAPKHHRFEPAWPGLQSIAEEFQETGHRWRAVKADTAPR